MNLSPRASIAQTRELIYDCVSWLGSMKDRFLNIPSFFLVIVAVFAVFFAWDVWTRVLGNLQLTAEDTWLDQQIVRADAENKKLIALKAAVQTDIWIEKFARTVLHYARPDETLVLPRSSAPANSASSAPTPLPQAISPTPAPPQSKPFWIDLLDWLFGPPE
jgi:hypothetical protein